MKNIEYKRLFAFLIDMLLVLVVVSAISSIKFVNPYKNEYEVSYTKVQAINKRYEDKKIDKDEYIKQYSDAYYKMERYNVVTNIVSFVVIGCYFVLVPYFNKGQTLGKKILGIKIKPYKDGKVKLYQYLVRSVIINYLWLYIIRIILVNTLDSNTFYSVMNKVQSFGTLIVYACGCMVIFSKDKRGLHDVLANTVVTDIDASSSIKEAEYVEVKKKVRKKIEK